MTVYMEWDCNGSMSLIAISPADIDNLTPFLFKHWHWVRLVKSRSRGKDKLLGW